MRKEIRAFMTLDIDAIKIQILMNESDLRVFFAGNRRDVMTRRHVSTNEKLNHEREMTLRTDE